MQLLVATLRALRRADMPAAEQHRARWEAVARERLDEQLFGVSRPAIVLLNHCESSLRQGTDGVTKTLADLVMHDRELLVFPCRALALARTNM